MATYTDDFNRANGGLGANWTTETSTGAPQINTNQVRVGSVGTDVAALYSAGTFANDQYGQIDVITLTGNTRACGPQCRMASGAKTGYRFHAIGPLTAAGQTEIAKEVAGAFTSLSSGTNTLATTNTIRGEVSGTTLTLYVAGVSVRSITDSSIASGFAGLIEYADTGAATDAILDNWGGGDLGGATALPPRNLARGQAVNRAATR